MNDHPEELLAEYVEGSLSDADRAAVEEHLGGCARCREEVGLARDARDAVATLPQLSAPPDLDLAVRRAIRDEPRPSRSRRLIGGLAAAAVLVGGGAVVVTSLQDGGLETSPESAPPQTGGGQAGEVQEDSDFEGAPAESSSDEVGGKARPLLPTYSESQRNYSAADLVHIARTLRDDTRAALEDGLEPTASQFFSTFDVRAFTPEVRQAIRCVLADVPPEQLIVPFSIEAAAFDEQPAYVVAFLQGPTPDDPYDRIVIWVVDREGCSLLSLATQKL